MCSSPAEAQSESVCRLSPREDVQGSCGACSAASAVGRGWGGPWSCGSGPGRGAESGKGAVEGTGVWWRRVRVRAPGRVRGGDWARRAPGAARGCTSMTQSRPPGQGRKPLARPPSADARTAPSCCQERQRVHLARVSLGRGSRGCQLWRGRKGALGRPSASSVHCQTGHLWTDGCRWSRRRVGRRGRSSRHPPPRCHRPPRSRQHQRTGVPQDPPSRRLAHHPHPLLDESQNLWHEIKI